MEDGLAEDTVAAGMSTEDVIVSAVAFGILFFIFEARRFFFKHLPRTLVVTIAYLLVLPLIYTPELLHNALMQVRITKQYKWLWDPVVSLYVRHVDSSVLIQLMLHVALACECCCIYWVF